MRVKKGGKKEREGRDNQDRKFPAGKNIYMLPRGFYTLELSPVEVPHRRNT